MGNPVTAGRPGLFQLYCSHSYAGLRCRIACQHKIPVFTGGAAQRHQSFACCILAGVEHLPVEEKYPAAPKSQSSRLRDRDRPGHPAGVFRIYFWGQLFYQPAEGEPGYYKLEYRNNINGYGADTTLQDDDFTRPFEAPEYVTGTGGYTSRFIP